MPARLVLVALVLLPLGAFAGVAPAKTPATAAAVDRIFSPWNNQGQANASPGCAVAVSDHGRTLLERAYGMADLERAVPSTPATRYETGSIAKQFTAAAIVLLAQEGKLALDDPLSRYLPELPAWAKTITLRQMLHHTSGLREWSVLVALAGAGRGTRRYTHAHILDLMAHQRALNHVPGAEYIYSNSNYALLVTVVDRTSGMSFAEYTRRRIFMPLGMTHTEWRDDMTRIVPGRALAYAKTNTGYHLAMPFEDVHGAGGLLTTVGDLLRWNENFVHPQVGGQALVVELAQKGRLTSGRELTYAKGLVVTRYHGTPEISHGGATAGYRAFLARFPQAELSVALLCNTSAVDSYALAHRVADLYLGSLARPPAPPPKVTVAPEALQRLAGLYYNAKTAEILRLVVEHGMLRTAQGEALVPLGPALFALGDDDARLNFIPARGNQPELLRLVPSEGEGEAIDYPRVVEVHPGGAALAAYAGTYQSDELEVRYQALVEGDALVLRRRPDTRIALRPAQADVFDAPDFPVVVFRRAPDGQITGFSLSEGNARDLGFHRVAP